jgi:hypothetical protein
MLNAGLRLPNGETYEVNLQDIAAPPDECDAPAWLQMRVGLPNGYPCRRAVFGSHNIPELHGFVGYALGFPALWDWQQGEPPCPYGPHEAADLVLYPIFRLRLSRSSLAIERHYPPSILGHDLIIRGLDRAHSLRQLSQIHGAEKFLKVIEAKARLGRPGRPRDEVLLELSEAAAEIWATTHYEDTTVNVPRIAEWLKKSEETIASRMARTNPPILIDHVLALARTIYRETYPDALA